MINSFRYRFILSFVTVEIFFILFIVIINFLTINESSSKLIQNRIDSSSQLMSELIKSPISVYDIATLDNIIKNNNLKNINSIILLDSNERILSKNYNIEKDIGEIIKLKKDTTLNIEKKNFDIKYIEIFNETIKLGSIYIVFDMSEFTKLIDENKTNTILIVLIEILISTLIAYLIGYSLTSHLTKLSNTAKKLGKSDDLNVDIPYQDDKTEIGILAKSLEQMKNDISSRNIILKNTKDVFENIHEAIIVFNENGVISLANEAFFKITKYEDKHIIEKNIFEIDFGISTAKLITVLETLKDKDSWQGEVPITNSKIGSKIILLNFSKIESNNRLSYILIFNDISEEKEKENLLQVQSKMATMGEMIGNIAHQWRQPLSAISSTASGIKLQTELEILDEHDLKKGLDDIVRSTQYLSDTIEDFRDFFKADKTTIDFKMSDIIFKISSILNSLLVSNQIQIKERIKSDPIINGYQNELTQAIINIINNAKDVLITNDKIENKTIIVEVDSDSKDNVTIKISDNAGGIPKDIIDKIFEPYFTTKHKSQGTGIGLYMTHTIITKHFSGKISVKNEKTVVDGKEYMGASFSIIIPINKD